MEEENYITPLEHVLYVVYNVEKIYIWGRARADMGFSFNAQEYIEAVLIADAKGCGLNLNASELVEIFREMLAQGLAQELGEQQSFVLTAEGEKLAQKVDELPWHRAAYRCMKWFLNVFTRDYPSHPGDGIWWSNDSPPV